MEKYIEIGLETMKLTLMLGLPMLMAGLIAGLTISIFQATTQINEMTLSFIPKIMIVGAVLIILMPWMLGHIIEFTSQLWSQIGSITK
jgi:flagellar biosynthetic protein FliQ